MTNNQYHTPIQLTSLAAHIDRDLILLTVDLARGLLDGRQYSVGNLTIGAVPNERDLLKLANWASRAVEVRS